MSSTAEAELGERYINSKLSTQMWHTLAEMGHPQPPIPVQTNNSTAYGIVKKIIPGATNAMDMHFHWLHDCKKQNHSIVTCDQGEKNYTNYWTKNHSTAHHKLMQQAFLTMPAKLNEIHRNA